MKLPLLFLILSAALFSTGVAAETTTSPRGKILFVLTSHDQKGDTGKPTGFYLGEATHPYEVVTKAGYAVEFVSPKGGKAPVDGFDLKDPVNNKLWNDETFRKGIEHTMKPDQVRAQDYAAVLYVGGHGTMWDFPDQAQIASLAAAVYDRGGVVAAVCHGPAGLLNVCLANGDYLVKGKNVAAFTNEEEAAVKLEKVVPFLLADELEKRGANHQAAPNFEKKVVVSERLVTGQNPASATGVGEEIVKLLDTQK